MEILKNILRLSFYILAAVYAGNVSAQGIRQEISLNENWWSKGPGGQHDHANSYLENFNEPKNDFEKVNIPHNWDQYHGYRRLLHGNLHGDSWYRKHFSIRQTNPRKRFFLFFEGVGAYATVYLNGKLVGQHAGGRTTFTIDVTDVIHRDGKNNVLAVYARHPAGIKDLPWVCGGCSEERGFSEGSQPTGIFRPVHLIITNDVRIEPFGIHAWSSINQDKALLQINTTTRNYSARLRKIVITHQLLDHAGKVVTETVAGQSLRAGDSIVVSQKDIAVPRPRLWSAQDPYLYRIVSTIKENGHIVDRIETPFGFRTISWKNGANQFLLNGKPVFINGVAEYEHLLGQSHAFSSEQIIARMKWVKTAGFNGFRDGHQPHNLLYGQLCNTMGILWWTQLSAHVWYDTEAFRNNFKHLLRQWVIERRNDPSVVLWGLQNESQLPEDFARECTQLIRDLDPTTSTQRLVTTCNGGSGTDWDVPQNWTGTYGGNPDTYANDVKKQVLIGEYGAWRTIDLHTEGPYRQNGPLSEDRMTLLMEQKVRLAESVKDSSAGQFFWLLASHDNPGRVQGGEGLRELDRIGPVNYKGLLTPWEEPLDVFYMFRSNYAPKDKEPMVYIVSHTWPGRWTTPGLKDSIIIYSNCDEVELFNDVDAQSLGRRRRNGIGTHFQWDDVMITYNILYAVGYVNGEAVARDTIVLHHLPMSPGFAKLFSAGTSLTKPRAGYHYIYRVNCGGADIKDENGNTWSADKSLPSTSNLEPPTSNLEPPTSNSYWGSVSWTRDFPGMPDFFASQRRIFDPVRGTRDWELFQDFRYGRDKLRYEFPLPDGEYLVELYFIEPWLGTGGGYNASGMRLFNVAINDKTVLTDIDLWKEAGSKTAVKKTIRARITGGRMIISFPGGKVGQAVISAIAIASAKKDIPTAESTKFVNLSEGATSSDNSPVTRQMEWLDIGDYQYSDERGPRFKSLPSFLYGAGWLQFPVFPSRSVSLVASRDADIYIAVDDTSIMRTAAWANDFEDMHAIVETDERGGKSYAVYRHRLRKATYFSLPRVPGNFSRIIMYTPATSMQPAFDLKQVISYRTNVAVVSADVQKEMIGGRECASVKSNAEVNVQWPVQTGVADVYAITVKYRYQQKDSIHGKMQLIGPGNTMMLEEPVSFTFTREGKWNQFTFDTRTMINAGNYVVKLIIEGAEGLAISGIEVQ